MIVGIIQVREPLIRLTVRGFRERSKKLKHYSTWVTLVSLPCPLRRQARIVTKGVPLGELFSFLRTKRDTRVN